MRQLPVAGWVGVVVLLCVVTLALHRPAIRYEPTATLAPLDELADGDGGLGPAWEVRARPGEVVTENGRLVLSNDAERSAPRVRRHVALPEEARALAVGARVGAEKVVPTGGRRPGAAVYVAWKLPSGALAFGKPVDVARLRGTHALAWFEDVFERHPEAVGAVVGVHLVSVTGRMTVEDLQVRLLRDRPFFAKARRALVGAWTVTLLWGASLFVLRADRRRVALAALGAFALTAALLLLPHGPRGLFLGWAGEVIPGIGRGEAAGNLGHVLLFVVIGLSGAAAFSRRRVEGLVVPLLALAVASEVIQLLTDERSVELADAMRNAAGALAGLLVGVIGHLAVKLVRHRRANRRPAGR